MGPVISQTNWRSPADFSAMGGQKNRPGNVMFPVGELLLFESFEHFRSNWLETRRYKISLTYTRWNPRFLVDQFRKSSCCKLDKLKSSLLPKSAKT